jgi:hypothetical protein
MPPPPDLGRKVIQKQVGGEGTILHPASAGRNDAANARDQFLQVVVCALCVDHHPVVPSSLVEILLDEAADFNRRIDQNIIVGGGEAGGRRIPTEG